MTTATTPESVQAWREHAYPLVQWTLQRLVNRADVYGHYPDRGPDDPCVEPEVVKGSLSERRLGRHYAATSRGHIVAVHAMSAERTTRWLMIGFRRQSESGDGPMPVTPGMNFDIALQWHERLRGLGFDPILEDGDGQGGYRLLTLFDEPVAADKVHAFGQQVTADYADKGLGVPPRVVPAAGQSGDRTDEMWLRLPGLHPCGAHASRVWDGDRWLDGMEAIAALLRAKATPPTFIRSPRESKSVVRVSSPSEPGRPVVMPKASPPEPRRRSVKVADNAETTILPAMAAAGAVALRLTPPPDVEMPAMQTAPGHAAPAKAPVSSAASAMPEDATTIIDAIAQRTGLRDGEVVRRMFAWFNEQDEVVQALVLGQIPQALLPHANQLLVERLTT